MIVVRDAGPVLVHAHDRSINHLHRRVMTGNQRIHDLVPHAACRGDCNKSCGDHVSPAGRAMATRTLRGFFGSIEFIADEFEAQF